MQYLDDEIEDWFRRHSGWCIALFAFVFDASERNGRGAYIADKQARFVSRLCIPAQRTLLFPTDGLIDLRGSRKSADGRLYVDAFEAEV